MVRSLDHGADGRAPAGGGVGGALQQLRSRGAGRRAAAERPERQPADPGPAGRLGRAAAGAAGGWRGVERPEGRRLDGAASRAGEGASPARLGGAEAAGVVGPDTAAAPSARGNVRRPGSAQKSWTKRSRKRRPRLRTGRSRSGPKTSTV